jgi:trans-aconitate 2-methyltransferase
MPISQYFCGTMQTFAIASSVVILYPRHMPTWNPGQYLRFSAERTRPCRDLANALTIDTPRRIIDLGCGPGNSTSVLAERWPRAEVVGMDNSQEMIAAARRDAPERTFHVGDIATWSPDGRYDLVFSNAALQWVENHEDVYPRLLGFVASGGAFAAQMPCNKLAPAHVIMRELAQKSDFFAYFGDGVREWHVHDAAFYYDVLAPHADRVDIWQTEYLHILPDAAAIVDWYKGTGLRPFLDCLPDADIRARFLDLYLEAITRAYPARRDGHVILPFQRLFIVAYR